MEKVKKIQHTTQPINLSHGDSIMSCFFLVKMVTTDLFPWSEHKLSAVGLESSLYSPGENKFIVAQEVSVVARSLSSFM